MFHRTNTKQLYIITPGTTGGRHRSGGNLPQRSREVATQARTTVCGPKVQYTNPTTITEFIYNTVRSLHIISIGGSTQFKCFHIQLNKVYYSRFIVHVAVQS